VVLENLTPCVQGSEANDGPKNDYMTRMFVWTRGLQESHKKRLAAARFGQAVNSWMGAKDRWSDLSDQIQNLGNLYQRAKEVATEVSTKTKANEGPLILRDLPGYWAWSRTGVMAILHGGHEPGVQG
jgi:hypothetical protein